MSGRRYFVRTPDELSGALAGTCDPFVRIGVTDVRLSSIVSINAAGTVFQLANGDTVSADPGRSFDLSVLLLSDGVDYIRGEARVPVVESELIAPVVGQPPYIYFYWDDPGVPVYVRSAKVLDPNGGELAITATDHGGIGGAGYGSVVTIDGILYNSGRDAWITADGDGTSADLGTGAFWVKGDHVPGFVIAAVELQFLVPSNAPLRGEIRVGSGGGDVAATWDVGGAYYWESFTTVTIPLI